MFRMMTKKARGFSLIELLIVVAIIGIISAIAFPAYTQYLVRAGRAEGASMLMQVMERQENHYRNNLTYSTNLSDIGYSNSSAESETGLYLVTASTCATGSIRRCILLTATAQDRQAGDGNFTLNSRGERSANWPEL